MCLYSQTLFQHLNVSSGYLTYKISYQLFLWPYLLSPLKNIPGPPLGNPLWGQMSAMVNREVGHPQREWVAKHGPTIRVVGPIGIERMIFTNPEALHQILVKDWLDYPRVRRRIFSQGLILNLRFFTKPSYLKSILGLVTGYGLLTVTGDDHRQMRKVMNPAFSLSNLMTREFSPTQISIDVDETNRDIHVF